MPEQQIDPRLLDQTRREITKILQEIGELAEQDIAAAEFYAEYLRRVAAALAARSTALWMRTPQGNLQLQYQLNLQAIGLDASPQVRQQHDELLRFAVRHAKPLVVPPQAGPGDESSGEQITNPTNFVIVLAPILVSGQVVGIVEVFQDGHRRSAAQPGYARFLSRIADEAAKFLKNRQYRQLIGQQELWNNLEAYIRSVHGGLHPKQVAYLIANDGRKLIACERVSVAIRYHKRTVVEAISGQDIVERRSNLVQRLARLVDRVLKHGENLLYNGLIEERWPKDVVSALMRYLEESPSKMIAVVPLEDQREFGRRGHSSAALVVEMIEDRPQSEDMGGRIEVVARHGSIALYNALEYHRVFLLPLWRALGNCTQFLTGRAMPKVAAAVAVCAALVGTLIFVPWPLRLEGRGELVPEIRRIVYAPLDGTIRSVKVDREDLVDNLSPLLEMSNPELELEEKKLRGERMATDQALRALLQQDSRTSKDPDLGGKINQSREKLASLEQQLRLIEEQKKRLQITSPIRGRVMDWNPKERLLSRPVKQGDPLLEIADVEGRWIIELQLPEDTITHIGRARQKSQDGTLPVTYVISASPDKTYSGTLYQVSTQARPVEQENVVEARVALEDSSEKPPREWADVEVRAKVDCGPHPLGYVLFRELIDFIREYVFF
jgi:hypothetical protein